jgi:hypothetical protein
MSIREAQRTIQARQTGLENVVIRWNSPVPNALLVLNNHEILEIRAEVRAPQWKPRCYQEPGQG